MILVDTNVVSEVMKSAPNPTVDRWLDAQAPETLYLPSVAIAESLYGIAILPAGKRKRELRASLDRQLQRFKGGVLSFDARAAHSYAELAAAAKLRGDAYEVPDAYIAAIAASRGYSVATRDATASIAFGVPVINPWESAP